jgi:hypothetical protein
MPGSPAAAIIKHMDGACILVACELTCYRQALAGAFRALRPNSEVFEAESECLDQAVERLGPYLVVCDTVSIRVQTETPCWVELYAGHEDRSSVSIRGERSIIEQRQLADLLSIIDSSESAVSYPVQNRAL